MVNQEIFIAVSTKTSNAYQDKQGHNSNDGMGVWKELQGKKHMTHQQSKTRSWL